MDDSRRDVLIIKTGALGDVLRTTSIVPGLRARYAGARIEWVTADAAFDLVAHHAGVDRVHALDPKDAQQIAELGERLAPHDWLRVLSFDDEAPLCHLATRCAGQIPGVLAGAFARPDGRLAYTPDSAAWFEMGLLSEYGKEHADRSKKQNEASHAQIFARMLGIDCAEPELPLDGRWLEFGRRFAREHGLHGRGPLVGVNTGAGGRWESKRLSVQTTAALLDEVHGRLGGRVTFLLLGGADERSRNDDILARVAERGAARVVDAGTDHPLLAFAALVDQLDVLLSSDSLALHVAVARRRPVVAFFAPTSAAEIELFGRGEKLQSLAPDYCSYRADADVSTLTVPRLADALLRVLETV